MSHPYSGGSRSEPPPAYARRELELALLVVVGALAIAGVNATLRLALDTVPPPVAAPRPARVIEPLDAYAPIAARDIFNGAAPAVAGDLGLRFVGVGFQAGEARAAVEDAASKRQDLLRVGDSVGDARVTSITWDHLVFATPSGERVLELVPTPDAGVAAAEPAPAPALANAPGATIRQISADGFLVDRRELAGAVDDMSGLMTQLRAVAEVRDGRPAGFRLFQMKDDSLFRRLGLENGDVVQRVNGEAVSDPATLLRFLDRLRSESRVALDIRRGADRRTLVYDLR